MFTSERGLDVLRTSCAIPASFHFLTSSSHPCLRLSCPLLAMKSAVPLSGRSCFLLMSVSSHRRVSYGSFVKQRAESSRRNKKATTHTKQKNKKTKRASATALLSAKLLAMYTNKQLLKRSATCFSSFVGLFWVPVNASLLKERCV